MTMKMLVPLGHVVGVLLLFVSLGVEWVAIRALSRSPTLRRAERWARRSLRWQIAAAAVILASGVAMAARLELFHFAWVNVSLVGCCLSQRSQESSVDLAAAPWTFAFTSSGLPRSRSALPWRLASST